MADLKIIRGAAKISLLLLAIFAFSKVGAQTARPQFMITWQAASYAPLQFSGKVLPTANSLVKAAVNLIDGGKLVDLSKQTIYWYANDNLIGGGEGARTASFVAPAAPSKVDLRVQLPNYNGSLLLKTISIPIVRPEAVIEAPYAGAKFGNYSLAVSGMPYFFNIVSPSALNFSWSVNGKTPTNSENPDKLNINLGQGAPLGSGVDIGLTLQNPANAVETAFANINLTFSQ